MRLTLLTGLRAFYKMDSLNDSSGNANTLTDHASVAYTTITGPPLNGLSQGTFNGTSQYLSIADNTYFQMGTGDFSVACWVNTSGSSSSYYWACYADPGNTGWGLFDDFGGVHGAAANNFTAVGYASAASITGAWHCFVMVCSRAGNLTIYEDGTVVPTAVSMAAISGLSVNNAIGFQIGARNGGNFGLGTISQVGVWNRALTGTEVSNFYNAGTAGVTYPFTGY